MCAYTATHARTHPPTQANQPTLIPPPTHPKDKNGATPLDLAVKKSQHQVAHFLRARALNDASFHWRQLLSPAHWRVWLMQGGGNAEVCVGGGGGCVCV